MNRDCLRTDSSHPEFIRLVKLLDDELAIMDGDDHAFYAQFNKIVKIRFALVCYEEGKAVGCGAIKDYDATSMEIKRMYTLAEYRGRGIASMVLNELEKWAVELGYNKCVLETGKQQPDAISLYRKSGYQIIPNYGQYKGVDNSLCFEKEMNQKK